MGLNKKVEQIQFNFQTRQELYHGCLINFVSRIADKFDYDLSLSKSQNIN